MIKRIKKISQVGSFYKSQSTGSLDFGKVTIFHGRNTYGKSTLTDIFNSIAENMPVYLTDRKSIPESSEKQEIELSYMKRGKEESLRFSGAWSNNDLEGNVLVFDSNFIHKNLISGSEVTRENKEAFTDFILGEEGVALSQEISEKKRLLANDKANLKTLRPDYVKNSTDEIINKFVNFIVVESKEDLLTEQLKQEKLIQNIGRINEIKQLPLISIVDIAILDELEKFNNQFNDILKLSFSNFTEETSKKFVGHLEHNTLNTQTTEEWIKEGYQKHLRSEMGICPFCSQKTQSVLDLLNIYKEYFNDEYGGYVDNNINRPLDLLSTQISRLSFETILAGFQKQIINISKYKDYSLEITSEIDLSLITGLIETINGQLTKYKSTFFEKLKEKQNTPHQEFPELKIEAELSETVSDLKLESEKLNTLLLNKTVLADSLKVKYDSLSDEDILTKKAEAEKIINSTRAKVSRLEQDADCTKFRDESERLNRLDVKILELTQKLENQQSDYLKTYFNDLNSYFIKLGSSDFSLKCANSDRGYKKAYYIDVNFKNKPISMDKLNKVFSESDKRSLAFAIFLAKVKQTTKKTETIIVLDDPVVSFDEHRIRITADLMSELSKQFEQLVIFSHYRSFIAKLADIKIENAIYFDITKDNSTCSFCKYDMSELNLSEMDRAFEKIWGYINHIHNNDIAQDCRIFFEKYLNIRFKKGIKEASIISNNLSELLQGLKNANIIDQEKQDKLEDFRKGLNRDHHEFGFGDNNEDNITYAKSMLEYIYSL